MNDQAGCGFDSGEFTEGSTNESSTETSSNRDLNASCFIGTAGQVRRATA
jgi:hypothetical protein